MADGAAAADEIAGAGSGASKGAETAAPRACGRVADGAVGCPQDVWDAYSRMSDRLRRVAYRVLGDGHEAEDVVHDAVLAAHRGVHRLRDASNLDGWLLRIARNTAATHVRRRRRCRPNDRVVSDTGSPDDAAERVALRFGSPEPSPVEAAAVRAAVESLSGTLRRTLHARVERGLTLAEIAAEEGVSLSCVKARVSRLHARLHECF